MKKIILLFMLAAFVIFNFFCNSTKEEEIIMKLETDWSWWQKNAPNRSYDHTLLFKERILGQWFCLERKTGKVIWSHNKKFPNTIWCVKGQIIIATETLSYGPSTGGYGIYGIDFNTGRVLWINHEKNSWEQKPSKIELVKKEKDWDRDSPLSIIEDGLLTSHGRVLDIQTGKQLRKLNKKNTREYTFGNRIKIDKRLYSDGVYEVKRLGRLYLGTGETYKEVKEHTTREKIPDLHIMPAHMGRGSPFGFTFESMDGEILWEFDLPMDNYYIDGNYYSYREWKNWVFMVFAQLEMNAQEWFETYYHTDHPVSLVPYFISVLDLKTGKIISKIPIGEVPLKEAEIDDIDESSILVSAELPPDRLIMHITLKK